jgi:PhnB protein
MESNAAISSSIVPWLNVPSSSQAIEFYKAAFGAVEVFRLEHGDSVVARFWVGDESPQHFNFSPQSLSGSTVRIIFSVADPDAVVARAVEAGASEVYPVAPRHGWRLGRIADPYGHHWEIGRPPAPS